MPRRLRKPELIFEDALSDDWAEDLEVIEVPLNEKPLLLVGGAVLLLALLVAGRIFFLGVVRAGYYEERADLNSGKYERLTAPRGLITDREGVVLAENSPSFTAYLRGQELKRRPESRGATLTALQNILGFSAAEAEKSLDAAVAGGGEPSALDLELNQKQIVAIKEANLPTLSVDASFQRIYPLRNAFSSVLGYVGLTSPEDLARDPDLSHQDVIGKSGLELQYDDLLRGQPGIRVKLRDAKGNVLSEQEERKPAIGQTLKLSIDAGLQQYFYGRMRAGLASLGRTSGVALAMNPQTGEILSMINFPTYDNNIFSESGRGEERQAVLSSPGRPLFDRTVSGFYNPGSTIKPLVAVAALTENIVSPGKTIFSPGYLDVPNPYDPEKPSRFLDWRYQGDVDVYSALAQSSNVYFYEVGGGFKDLVGLGINRLRDWWQKFHLGQPTGIDLPGEASGFLPSPDWKEKTSGRNWLLGDTYNVAIGQGDLLLTPIQLLDYISAIANGGKIYKPFLRENTEPQVSADLTLLYPAIREVQKGMRLTVTSPLGTANLLNDLPFPTAAKTGSAQIQNNTSENAFFVGYAPYDSSPETAKIAVLVLVENSKEGSLNAVPIAKDVLNWYYENRLKPQENNVQ